MNFKFENLFKNTKKNLYNIVYNEKFFAWDDRFTKKIKESFTKNEENIINGALILIAAFGLAKIVDKDVNNGNNLENLGKNGSGLKKEIKSVKEKGEGIQDTAPLITQENIDNAGGKIVDYLAEGDDIKNPNYKGYHYNKNGLPETNNVNDLNEEVDGLKEWQKDHPKENEKEECVLVDGIPHYALFEEDGKGGAVCEHAYTFDKEGKKILIKDKTLLDSKVFSSVLPQNNNLK